ncbi:protein N-lysine methyltransferase METTL21A isoform X2 [Aplysia californica]|uniref:Protein N-lysine methyltransferase METTL21A isoform X2 n=1 Tax=Aplysia californica TaxID=6500 RepID=A0ABM0K999_APLCA|nr:protein N-lysine methyltransferase METTL21A isoform X2 [Aplysia californica]
MIFIVCISVWYTIIVGHVSESHSAGLQPDHNHRHQQTEVDENLGLVEFINNKDHSETQKSGCKSRRSCHGQSVFSSFSYGCLDDKRDYCDPLTDPSLSECTGDMAKETDDKSSSSTALAVVLYDESRILPHEKPSRSFQLAGEEFVIQQNWMGHGVAAVVWDSAVVLAEYMHTHPQLVRGKGVLELGAGTGLAGLVAASLGAEVVVTEREEAMNHLSSTVESNAKGKSWKISAQVLDWRSSSYDSSDVLPNCDVVLGADIIYIEDTFHDLLKTLKSVAATADTLVLLSCRIRYERDERFLNMLREFFDVREEFFDEEKQIRIYSARRKV